MKSGKAFENEYISRREAIKARKRSCNKSCLECDFAIEGDSWCNGEVFVVDLLRIPAADVRPVVLCRDCKHNKGKKIWADGDETFDCTNGHGYPPLDWFCADGEKREES